MAVLQPRRSSIHDCLFSKVCPVGKVSVYRGWGAPPCVLGEAAHMAGRHILSWLLTHFPMPGDRNPTAQTRGSRDN